MTLLRRAIGNETITNAENPDEYNRSTGNEDTRRWRIEINEANKKKRGKLKIGILDRSAGSLKSNAFQQIQGDEAAC